MITIVTILLLVLFSDSVSKIISWIGDLVGSEEVSSRLHALAGGSDSLNKFEDNRLDMYTLSINQFVSYPLFGTLFASYKVNGGHSFILDSLASFGLFGGTLLFLMYKKIFTVFVLPYKEKEGFGFILWTYIQAIILSFINTGAWLEVLCLFVPLLIWSLYNGNEQCESIDIASN